MARQYHIKGQITFYIDGQEGKSCEFTTTYQRDVLIQSFLKDIKNISYRVRCWWIISVDENSKKGISKKFQKPHKPIKNN